METGRAVEHEEGLISIIMPCRDGERHVAEAVESVLAQTRGDWELIVVDDASRDGSAAILKGYAERDSRIRVVCNQSPGGPGRARNLALDMARGRYAAFLDADDTWRPGKLEAQVRYMRERGAALCGTQMETMDLSGQPLGAYDPEPGEYDFDDLLRENVASTSTMMADRRQCPDLRFGPTLRQEDYYGWMRQALKGRKVHIMAGRYTRYRLRPFSWPLKLRDAGHRMYINRRHLKVGFFRLSALFWPYALKSLAKMKGYYSR